MGLFSNAVYSFRELDSGVIHITDEGIDEISVTNDAEDVLLQIHKHVNLTGKKVQYTDSDGQIDRLLHERGVFTGFAPGPWPTED